MFVHFLSFSIMFFHFLSFSFIFFHFLSFSFIFFYFLSLFLLGAQNLFFLGLNFVTISIDSSYVKNQFWGPSRVVPFGLSFPYVPPFFFLPFVVFFLVFFIFLIVCSFLHFLIF